MVHIPVTIYIYATGYYNISTMYFAIMYLYIYIFCLNVVWHAVVDNLKANKKLINLWVDQVCHIIQIVLTWCFYISIRFDK